MNSLLLCVALVTLSGATGVQPASAAPAASAPAEETRQRLIVLSDIENEPDDSESMVRLLLYSNQIDIEGIVDEAAIVGRLGHSDG